MELSGQHHKPRAFTPVKEPQYWLNRMGEPQNRFEWFKEEKRFLLLLGIETRIFQPVATTDNVIIL
jgi:hypothetical protein